MYIQALKQAVRDQIRTVLMDPAVPAIDGAECHLTPPNGQPYGYSGQLFIAVHNSAFRNLSYAGAYHLEFQTGFDITLSWNTGFIPDWQMGNQLDDLSQGMDTHTDLIIRALVLDKAFTVLTAANALITAAGKLDQFLVGAGYQFTSAERIIERGDSWWGAARDSDNGAGYSRTLHFDGAVVMRDSSDITI